MKISTFSGSYTNLIPGETIDTWDELCDLCAQPKIGPKNGSYFVRGYCEGERSDKNIKTTELLIIDGDQLLSDGTSCCPPQPVHAVLKQHNITHMIYNSYSNDVINNRHKWRLIVPYEGGENELAIGVSEIISTLHSAKLYVKNVRENIVMSQPWFFPRCPDHTINDFYAAFHDGNVYVPGSGVVLDSARYTPVNGTVPNMDSLGQFSWDYVIESFASGTLHLGLKSATGWLVKTTDWADVQIKQHLVAIVKSVCPDPGKVKRATDTKEIDKLIDYCRKKTGITNVGETDNTGWKNYIVSAAGLREKGFPDVVWAVDGIIPEGLTVLGGDPKAGKSLMAVDICSAVASGIEAFGNRRCVQGGAIYISMEDPERRVKERIKQQCDLWPEAFRIVTGGIPTLGEQFYVVLDEMMMIYPDIRVIVVDTLQFVVPPKPKNLDDYAHYYALLDPLHRWALDNHVAVVCITHKNKSKHQDGENHFAGIIGSVAIQGTADAMILLSKNHAKEGKPDHTLPDGFMRILGREVEGSCFALDFDSEAMKWAIRGDFKPGHVTGNANWLLIIKSLEEKPRTPKEIADHVNMNHATVKTCLTRMRKKGLAESNGGVWSLPNKIYEVEEW